jgi:hypothetical protein
MKTTRSQAWRAAMRLAGHFGWSRREKQRRRDISETLLTSKFCLLRDDEVHGKSYARYWAIRHGCICSHGGLRDEKVSAER